MAAHRRCRGRVGLAGLAVCLAGCTSTRNDVTYNPYLPTDGDPSVMQSADRLMDCAGEWLGDLDLRFELAVP